MNEEREVTTWPDPPRSVGIWPTTPRPVHPFPAEPDEDQDEQAGEQP